MSHKKKAPAVDENSGRPSTHTQRAELVQNVTDPAALPKELGSGVHEKPASASTAPEVTPEAPPVTSPVRVHECCGLPWSTNYTPKAALACVDRLPKKFRALARLMFNDAANYNDKPHESAGHCYSGRLWFAEKLGFKIVERPARRGRGPSRDCPHMRQLWIDFVAYVNAHAEVGFTLATTPHYRKGGKGGKSTDHFVLDLTACGQAASPTLTACGQAELTACGQAGAPPVDRRSYYPGPAPAGTRGEYQTADAGGPAGPARQGVALAADFTPDAEAIALAAALGRDINEAVASMRDHAADVGRVSCDWQAALRRWLRTGAQHAAERAERAERARAAKRAAAARKAAGFRAACATAGIMTPADLDRALRVPGKPTGVAARDAVAALLDVDPAGVASLNARQRAKCAKALKAGRE